MHVGLFWDAHSAITFLVEPDNQYLERDKIRKYCQGLGFETASDGKCLRFDYVPGTASVSNAWTILAAYTKELAAWPIVGLRELDQPV